jgi:hypothetical protein
MHGKWEIKGNTNCVDCKERPNTACVRHDETGGVVTVIGIVSVPRLLRPSPATPKGWHPDEHCDGESACRT